MVIAIADANIESDTTIELLQISLYICTVLNNEINYIQISVFRSGVVSIIKPQQSHSRSKMNPFPFLGSVEALR